MISGGISTSVIFSSFYSDMGDGFRMLSIFWLVVGIVFMFVALFGIFAAFKESAVAANLVRQILSIKLHIDDINCPKCSTESQ